MTQLSWPQTALSAVIACLMIPANAYGAKATLTVWSLFVPKETGIDRTISDYEKSHPNTRVKYSQIDWGTDKFLQACAGGVAPDVILAADAFIRTYIDHGLLSPAPGPIEKDLRENFYTGIHQMAIRKGKAYGLPLEFQFYALAYNKTLFQQKGLVPEAPATWEDLSLAARKLAISDGTRITRSGFCAWANGGVSELPSTLLALWASAGASPLPDDLKTFSLLTPERREGLQFLASFVQNGSDGVNAKLNPWTDFPAGKLPMWINGLWTSNAKQFKDKAVYRSVDIAPLPRGKVGSVTDAWSWLACVPMASKRKAEAWEFVRLLTNEEHGRDFAERWNTAIPRIGVTMRGADHVQSRFPQIASTVGVRAIYNAQALKIYDLMGRYAQEAVIGKRSVDDALSRMEREMKALQR